MMNLAHNPIYYRPTKFSDMVNWQTKSFMLMEYLLILKESHFNGNNWKNGIPLFECSISIPSCLAFWVVAGMQIDFYDLK